MQQGGGGSQYGMSTPEVTATTTCPDFSTAAAVAVTSSMSDQLKHSQILQSSSSMVVEAASPISSRPPPSHPSGSNFEELGQGGGGFPDEEGFGGDDGLDRGGVGGGNRWPRQETMALLKIRSEMDIAFRDATLKGPLWEDVSRKLLQQGYTRSAKKCKEKFENVHKYYKRTKEGRAGRQDGKSYRFFSQLEALHTTSTPPAPVPVVPVTTLATTINIPPPLTPVSIGIRMAGSSARTQLPPLDSAIPSSATTATSASAAAAAITQIGIARINPPDSSGGLRIGLPGSSAAFTGATAGLSFSSNTSSSDYDDSEDDLLEGPFDTTTSRKRKRGLTSGSNSSRKMMDFFEGLMKQVMEKQEAMQQRFLETIEKREQDRMIREEAWKRQEMARLAREHEIMAHERSISASRDAAIIAFLQKITGQTIQFPPPVVIPAAPPPQITPIQATPPPPTPAPQPQPQQQTQPQHHYHQQPTPPPQLQQALQTPLTVPPQPQQQQQQHHHHQNQQQLHTPPPHSTEIVRHQPTPSTDVVVAAIPEQQHPPHEMISASDGFDSTSSRWPKQEVLALIKLRSGLESRYQEAGPKGPLWEEISTGMQRMGYNRNSKRCKEKWENINKYFKKVKESNKKRPEDAKTCPYFHQLDALYRKKMLGGGGSSSSAGSFGHQNKQEEPMAIDPTPVTQSFQAIMPPPPVAQVPQTSEAENKSGHIMEEKQTIKEGDFEEGNSGAEAGALKKPEDIMKELIEQHHHNHHHHRHHQQQQQQQNAGGSSSNGGGGNAPNSSFLAIVSNGP